MQLDGIFPFILIWCDEDLWYIYFFPFPICSWAIPFSSSCSRSTHFCKYHLIPNLWKEMDFSPSVCQLEVTASLDNSKFQRDGWGSCLRERKNHKEASKIMWATLCLLTLQMAQGLKPSPRCATAQVWLTLVQNGSYSSSFGEVLGEFCPKAKPKLKRTQIRCNRTTAKPPQVISKEQKYKSMFNWLE